MGIKIICDAVSNLFKDIIADKNLKDVKVMSMHLRIGDKEYNCYDDEIDINEFSKTYYSLMEKGEKASTSLVNPNDYLEVFEEEVTKGNKIICYTMAKGISGTYNSACIAMEEINEKYKEKKVHVIDTMTAGLGEGMQVIRGQELINEGKSFEEIVEYAEDYKLHLRSDFTVDNIKFLLATGRASKYLSKFVNLLNIKILLKHNDKSEIAFAGSAIGRKNSMKKLAKMVIDKIDKKYDDTIYITHCNILEDALKFKKMLVDGGIKNNIEIYLYDIVSGAHIGPGTIAVFYRAREGECL